MGEALGRFALQTLAAIVVVGLIGAVIGWATGHDIAGAMAGAYYLIGAALFLIGMFPTGGFSMIRGTITRRKPTGARQEAQFLMGVVLVAVGVLFDLTRPF
jgi:membrane associated rhomboid family serine protease